MHGTGAPLGEYSWQIPDAVKSHAQQVAHVLQKASSILITGHTNADGDVVGSSLGLASALQKMGKSVVVYNDIPYDSKYSFLDGAQYVVNQIENTQTFDATVVVDSAKMERLGKSMPDTEKRGTLVWIDHHRHDHAPYPGDVNYIDLTAAAVGEQIAEVLDAMQYELDADTAACLHLSLVSDTGGFRYGNTSARAHRLAARLVAAGADPWLASVHLYESQPLARMQLLGRCLHNMLLSSCRRAAVFVVSQKDLLETQSDENMLAGLVNYARGIDGVELAFLCAESMDTSGKIAIRVVLRSKGKISAHQVALQCQASGHKNAAQWMMQQPLIEAAHTVLQAAVTVLQESDAVALALSASI